MAEYTEQRVEQSGIVEKYIAYSNYARNGLNRVESEMTMMELKVSNALATGESAVEFDAAHYLRLNAIRDGYTQLLSNYGVRTMTTDVLNVATRKMLPLIDVSLAVKTVMDAPPNTRTRVAFEQTGQVVGGTMGSTAGAFVGVAITGTTGGFAAPLGLGITLFGAVGGATLGEIAGDEIYDRLNLLENTL